MKNARLSRKPSTFPVCAIRTPKHRTLLAVSVDAFVPDNLPDAVYLDTNKDYYDLMAIVIAASARC